MTDKNDLMFETQLIFTAKVPKWVSKVGVVVVTKSHNQLWYRFLSSFLERRKICGKWNFQTKNGLNLVTLKDANKVGSQFRLTYSDSDTSFKNLHKLCYA